MERHTSFIDGKLIVKISPKSLNKLNTISVEMPRRIFFFFEIGKVNSKILMENKPVKL